MASTKISDETTASTLTGSELVPVVQGGNNRKTTVADIARAGWGYTSLTADGTLSAGNRIVDVNTSGLTAPDTLEVTLPTPAAGLVIFLRKIAGQYNETITLVRAGSEKINGTAASYLLHGSNESVYGGTNEFDMWPTWMITSNGTDWRVTIVSQQVLHTRQSGAPSGDEPDGYYPGSTWCEAVQDPGSKLHMNMGSDAASADWMRIDAVDVVEIDNGDSPYTMPTRDRSIFVDTSAGVVSMVHPGTGGQVSGVQFSITKVNTGTNKITLTWGASTTVNGSSVTSYDLPGSADADYGRWHVVSTSNKVWITGGSALV